MKNILMDSPEELLKSLKGIFPGYVGEQPSPDLTYHGLLTDFTCYYGANNSTFSKQQVKDYATLINEAVETGGSIENAFATCFLEHLGQIRATKPLISFLSKTARERLHA